MNINEVEKHVKSEFIITIILYILTGLTMIISIIAILTTDVKALTTTNLNSKFESYSELNGCTQAQENKFCTLEMYRISGGNPCGNGDSQCLLSYNTSTDNKVVRLAFRLKIALPAYSNFTIRIEGDGFSNSSLSCATISGVSNCSINRVSNTQLNINFAVQGSTAINNAAFAIYNTSNGINPNFPMKITSMYLLQNPIQDSGGSGGSGGSGSSSFDDSGIINNANQNTQDIMSNASQNTQDIINNQNTNSQNTNNVIFSSTNRLLEQLASMCPNGININKLVNCDIRPTGAHYNCDTTISDVNINTGSFTMSSSDSWRGIATDYIPVNSGGTYYFKFNWNSNVSNRLFYNIYRYDNNKNILTGGVDGTWANNRAFSLTYNVPVNTHYIRITIRDANGNFSDTISDLYFGGKNQNYCVYGSTSQSKLDDISDGIGGVATAVTDVKDVMDDVKDIQQDTYDYMTDDSNPSVNSSEINNVIGQVQIQDPLNYLLTLPLNLLTKLNTLISSGTCSKASFGELYGTELYLPCINFENYLGSSLWTTIDTIVGIGLLVVILKKFYDSISNILSLGKEEEIRKGMEFPTPMEFLAQILGGGK